MRNFGLEFYIIRDINAWRNIIYVDDHWDFIIGSCELSHFTRLILLHYCCLILNNLWVLIQVTPNLQCDLVCANFALCFWL